MTHLKSPGSPIALKPVVSIPTSIISPSDIDSELSQLGYSTINKIGVDGSKDITYVKASNANGQTVFVSLGNGYQGSGCLMLTRSQQPLTIPHSLKSGAYDCADLLVSGVAFEYNNGICLIYRDGNSFQPKEFNYTLIGGKENLNSIMTYPIVLLNEIKANAKLVLSNTDLVTRRLRNSAYVIELQELETMRKSIDNLQNKFSEFNNKRNDIASKLNKTLDKLEEWNNVYMTNPFLTDEQKERWKLLQYNLTDRNNKIVLLLQTIKQITILTPTIDKLSREIEEINNYMASEFANVESAISE